MLDRVFKDKTILITGGTGFLGKKLTEEILKHQPKSVRVFSRDELKHHNIQLSLNNHERLRNLIGDVRDYERLRKAMRGVDIVIHAAALKRVDILEYNVEEVIKTNIIGTLNVVNACLENNVEKAIFVSTDKSCSPINTYGACKFVGERIFTESNYNKGDHRTIFTSVRYGNVLESTGSVIPFFNDCIKAGKKTPLTHKEMTRFVIDHEGAVELIATTLYYGRGGEVFVPKLSSMRIVDLIEVLKKMHKNDVPIEIIGIRPGEKVHELMINDAEMRRTYEFKNFYVLTSQIEKYIETETPEYVAKGKLMKSSKMKEYNSADHLISVEELQAILKKSGVLPG